MSTQARYDESEVQDDINNPGEEVVDYAAATHAEQDADVAKPPIPDSWQGTDGKYVKLNYIAIPDFQAADESEQFTRYESKRGDWSSCTLKLKVIGCENPAVPEELYNNKQLGFQRIDSMLRDGTSKYVDYIKSAFGKREGERLIRELQQEISQMPKSQVAARNERYLEGLEELIRQSIIQGLSVTFQGNWVASYESDDVNESTGKNKWKNEKVGMRFFPETDQFACGHLPTVDSPKGEIRANFNITLWMPNRSM